MKKLVIIIVLSIAANLTYSQDAGYCKFMRIAFSCADTNFALFADPENPFTVKPSVLKAGQFTSGELLGLQHMALELSPSDGSNYPENVRDSMMIATFDYLVENLHKNCYPELAMSMDMIKFNGKKTVTDKEQIISKYLFYFKEIDTGMKFPLYEGLLETPHLEVSLYQDLEKMNMYHIEYLFFTAKGFQIFSNL